MHIYIAASIALERRNGNRDIRDKSFLLRKVKLARGARI